MKPVVVLLPHDEFARGIAAFFSSLPWVYLTHRYPMRGQGTLLLGLTLSGLDAWWWSGYAMQFIHRHAQPHAMQQLVATTTPATVTPDALRSAIGEIWTYAGQVGAAVGKPPVTPTYLLDHGITQARYIDLVQAVYDEALDASYRVPWPEQVFLLDKPLVQPVLLHQAVAIMGTTAGAIERLIALGGNHDDHDE